MRWVYIATMLLCALTCWVSDSKLSIHLIRAYTPGARAVIAAGPRVIKILDIGPDMLAAARDYKQRNPKGIVVLRIYTTVRYAADDDPANSARDFVSRVLLPPISALSKADRALIDYVEGPNECESTPCWGTTAGAEWFSAFTAKMVRELAANGLKACVGSIPVGNPPGTPAEVTAQIDAFIPALKVALEHGGTWGYHAYTLEYSTDAAIEWHYSLRYRQWIDRFKAKQPDLLKLPLILTEGGVDRDGNPSKSGWKARGDAERYQRWLRWFDDEITKDPQVVGVTMFQIGDPNWPSFDLEPVAPWLAAHIKRSHPIKTTPGRLSPARWRGSRVQASASWERVASSSVNRW